jgi:Flp pilus assembly protein TadG
MTAHWRKSGGALDRCVRRALDIFSQLIGSARGNAAVEFALATPILMATLTPAVDLGIAFSEQSQVQAAAQAGARYALLHGWNRDEISSAVTNATTLTGLSALPVPQQSCGCPTGTGVTTTGISCNVVCGNGEYPGTYITVSAQVNYVPVLPYSLLGSNMTLSSQTMVRIQ